MPFKIKSDENLPRTIVQILQERSYDAVSVIEQKMDGKTLIYGEPYKRKNDF